MENTKNNMAGAGVVMLADAFLELLSVNYKKIDSLLDPVDIDVNVVIDNGQYLVMQQDQYLAVL